MSPTRKPRTFVLLIALMLLATPSMADAKEEGVSAKAKPTGPDVTIVTVHSTALEGNLLGDPADQPVAIYLPPGFHDTDARYPVLYLLHGIGDTFTVWTEFWNIPSMLDRLISAGEIDPMIVVMPNGRNQLMGSYYLNSPVTGGWEDFIGKELVDFVDTTYRTIPSSKSRSVAGHSMGGFGAINLGMRHADVFGVVYAMSPSALDFSEDIGWGNASWFKAGEFSKPEDLQASLQQGDFYPVAIIGLASVFSPNPDRPLLVDLPFRVERGQALPNEPVYSRWFDQFPINRVAEARENLKSLELFAIDYGIDDQFAHIPAGTARFSSQLTRYRIPHLLEVYDGDHRAMLPERIETRVLPMISSAFSRAEEKIAR